jgi:hypothetical protein
MAVIKRGIGFTSTEKNLATLADKIFLDLWSYPNLFRKDGKELCDLLAICGDDVLIFSDKNIRWPKGDDFNLSWSRWYRGAVEESLTQLNGAARYLREGPAELFLDATCKKRFPLAFPPTDRRRMHYVAIALGAAEVCAKYYNSAFGYFPIDPDLKGASHTNTTTKEFKPFMIGDVQPNGAYVHVFNEATALWTAKCIASLASTWGASLRAKNPLICRSCSRPNSCLRLISKRPRRLVSPFLTSCSPPPTR